MSELNATRGPDSFGKSQGTHEAKKFDARPCISDKGSEFEVERAVSVHDWRRRLFCFICSVLVTGLGLASRRYGANLPVFIAEYAGDTLWAIMVFFGISTVVPTARISNRGIASLAVAYGIEFSQLFHTPWIDAMRQTTLGGLVLGSGFLWTDIVCYTAGVTIGAAVDHIACSKVLTGLRNESSRVSKTST